MNSEADPPDPPAADDTSAAQAVRELLPGNVDERVQELFSCDYKPLVSHLVGLGLTRVEAEDIAAQAFAQLLQLKDLASISLLRAYLYKIARNIAFNRYAHLAMQQRNGPLLKAEHSEDSPSPEPGLEGQQRSNLLRQTLAQLPLRWRTALALRFWQDYSYPEIVEWFRSRGIRINERTVRRNVERGMEEIREAIQAAEAPSEEGHK